MVKLHYFSGRHPLGKAGYRYAHTAFISFHLKTPGTHLNWVDQESMLMSDPLWKKYELLTLHFGSFCAANYNRRSSSWTTNLFNYQLISYFIQKSIKERPIARFDLGRLLHFVNISLLISDLWFSRARWFLYENKTINSVFNKHMRLFTMSNLTRRTKRLLLDTQ